MFLYITELGLRYQRQFRLMYLAAIVYTFFLVYLSGVQLYRSLTVAVSSDLVSQRENAEDTTLTWLLVAIYTAIVSIAAGAFVGDVFAQRRLNTTVKKRLSLPSRKKKAAEKEKEEETETAGAGAGKKKGAGKNKSSKSASGKQSTKTQEEEEEAEAEKERQELEAEDDYRDAMNEKLKDIFILSPTWRVTVSTVVLLTSGMVYLLFYGVLSLQDALILQFEEQAAENTGGVDSVGGIASIMVTSALTILKVAVQFPVKYLEAAVLYVFFPEEYLAMQHEREQRRNGSGRVTTNPFKRPGADGNKLESVFSDAMWVSQMKKTNGTGADAEGQLMMGGAEGYGIYENIKNPTFLAISLGAFVLGVLLFRLLTIMESEVRFYRGAKIYDNVNTNNSALTVEALQKLTSSKANTVSAGDKDAAGAEKSKEAKKNE